MKPDPPVTTPVETKVFLEMTERTRWPVKKGTQTENLTLNVGQIIKCSKQTAAGLIKEKLAKDYDPDRLKVIEI